MRKKKICVIGLGYIGLPTATLFAYNKYQVYGVEKNLTVLRILKAGKIHINERGLKQMALDSINKKKLLFGKKPIQSDVFIICVPTPIKHGKSNQPDLSFVRSAITEIIPVLQSGNLIILESTSPVGTINMIYDQIKKSKTNATSVNLAYCPERVLPGNIVFEMINNDRVVGGINKQSTNQAATLYSDICRGKIFRTDSRIAELCKLSENSFRDINIAFANELSLLCDHENINVNKLISLANKHPRVNILKPGIGVGGHCIPIDPWFIFSKFPKFSSMIKNARKVNNAKTNWVVSKILEKLRELKKKKPKIACLGLTYKPDVADMRESPALKIFLRLRKKGLKVAAVEPNIKNYKNLKIISLNEALKKCDLIVILVAHKIFRVNIKIKLAKNFIDFCNAIKV